MISMVGKIPLNKLLCYIAVFCCVIIYILLDLTLNLGLVVLKDTEALSTKYYWRTYHTTTDVFKIAATIVWFLHVSYSQVVIKLFSAMVAAWFTVTGVVLFVSDHAYGLGFKDDRGPLIPDGSLVYIWLFIGAVIAVLGYRAISGVAKFKTIPISKGNLYLIKAKPSGLFQCATLALTGAGAWFSITDGEHIWEYDETVSKLVKIPFDKGYLNGRGVELICPTEPVKTHYLNMRVGDPYSNFSTDRNCIGFLKLSDRWQEEHNE